MAQPMYSGLAALFSFLSYSVFVLLPTSSANQPLHPRGVQLSHASFYKPGPTFACLDGTKTIPYEQVNDDYCDCSDNSDEPGTSACPNGRFFCTNKGHRPELIPSSRVDDGICDCCDGSDEYSGKVTCSNRCLELGRQMREEQDRERQLATDGYKMKLDYSQQGKLAKQDKHNRLTELGKLKTDLEAKKVELSALRDAAEAPEKEATARHESWWKDQLAEREKEKEKALSESAFARLDVNGDGVVTVEESAGLFSEETSPADLARFVSSVWPSIKDKYSELPSAPPAVPEPPTGQLPLPVAENVDLPSPPSPEEFQIDSVSSSNIDERDAAAGASSDDGDDDDFDEDDFEDKTEKPLEPPKPADDKMPDYPDDTQQLIKAADLARDNLRSVETELNSAVHEIENLEKFFNTDLGPEDEFYPLKGHCFEYTDREYIYKVCPFDKVTQRPKHGGSETSLGVWGQWSGSEDNKYSIMKFERGQGCWNGPDRSALVTLHCGNENKLSSASEPNRCEYAFDFSTPAACRQPVEILPDWHDEL